MSQPPPIPNEQPEDIRGPDYVAPAAGADNPRNAPWSGCLIGCLVVFCLAVLLCAGIGFVGYSQGKGWATQIARNLIKSTIEESKLPRAEKDAIWEQVDRVANAYEQGEIDLKELGQIMEELTESKIWGLVLVQGIEAKYLKPSGLSDDEKEQGRLTIDRILRGAIEGSIDDSELESLSEYFLEEVGNDPDTKRIRDRMSDDELRAMLATAKELADQKEIPEEEYDPRFSDKIREIVDEALR